MDIFTRQYIVTALWSSTTDDGDPMDASFSIEDLSEEALEMIKADCTAFQEENAADISNVDIETAGHDFWLTRNHHGAGFWDGDYPDDIGERLTEASHAFGESDLYVGDDGKLYIHQSTKKRSA